MVDLGTDEIVKYPFLDEAGKYLSDKGFSLEQFGSDPDLKKIVENLGISSTQFDKCLIDETISDKILNGRIDANQKYSINSTPTIVINEKKLEGSASF